MLTNVLIIIGGLILITFLLVTFGSANHGVMGHSIIIAIITSVITAYQKNINDNWIAIGAGAIKVFMTIVLIVIIIALLIHGIYYVKEEMSEWINKRKK